MLLREVPPTPPQTVAPATHGPSYHRFKPQIQAHKSLTADQLDQLQEGCQAANALSKKLQALQALQGP
jgi:hypothetical protein